MKTIVILLVVSFVAVLGEFTDEDHKKFKEDKEKCMTEFGVSSAEIEEAKNGGADENNEKLACMATCMLKKSGVMNEAGDVDWDVVREHMLKRNKSEEQINEMRSECENVGGEGCQKGRNLFKCFKRVGGDHHAH